MEKFFDPTQGHQPEGTVLYPLSEDRAFVYRRGVLCPDPPNTSCNVAGCMCPSSSPTEPRGTTPMLKIVKSEPVAVAGAVQAVVGLLAAFGLHLSPDQIGAVMAVVAAVLALVVRQNVSPTS